MSRMWEQSSCIWMRMQPTVRCECQGPQPACHPHRLIATLLLPRHATQPVSIFSKGSTCMQTSVTRVRVRERYSCLLSYCPLTISYY